MSLTIMCPHCGVNIKISESWQSKSAVCPKCRNRFMVPELATAPEVRPISSPPPVRTAVTENPLDFDGQQILEVTPAEDGNEKRPGEKFCIECGAVIRERAAICPKCGVSQSDTEGRKTKHCHECGAVIRGKAAVCPKCGVEQTIINPAATSGGGNRIAAGICALLIGHLGIHKFIMGMPGPGITMLLVSILGWGLSPCLIFPLAGPLVMCIIALVEGIIYLSKSDEQFYRDYVLGKKGWF